MREELYFVAPHSSNVVVVCVDARVDTAVRIAVRSEERILRREDEHAVDVSTPSGGRHDRACIMPRSERLKSTVPRAAALAEERRVAVADRVVVVNTWRTEEVAAHGSSCWIRRVVCVWVVHDRGVPFLRRDEVVSEAEVVPNLVNRREQQLRRRGRGDQPQGRWKERGARVSWWWIWGYAKRRGELHGAHFAW